MTRISCHYVTLCYNFKQIIQLFTKYNGEKCMKKRLLLGTVICALLVVLFSCSHEIGVGPGTKETVVEAKGSISGTVRYSNAEKD